MKYKRPYYRECHMPSIKPSQDVQPLSAFRANAAGFLDQVRSTKRPLVLTQHGKSAAVILDVDEYEALVDEVELIRDIREARAQLERGEGIAHDEVIKELRTRLPR
jgi:prevent-host-death family protein